MYAIAQFVCVDTCPVASLAGEDTSREGLTICRGGFTKCAP